MSLKWCLISHNYDGSISYLNSGTHRQMKKLEKHNFHSVISIYSYLLITNRNIRKGIAANA